MMFTTQFSLMVITQNSLFTIAHSLFTKNNPPSYTIPLSLK